MMNTQMVVVEVVVGWGAASRSMVTQWWSHTTRYDADIRARRVTGSSTFRSLFLFSKPYTNTLAVHLHNTNRARVLLGPRSRIHLELIIVR